MTRRRRAAVKLPAALIPGLYICKWALQPASFRCDRRCLNSRVTLSVIICITHRFRLAAIIN